MTRKNLMNEKIGQQK